MTERSAGGDLTPLVCQGCGEAIQPGGAFYVCRTEIVSGFDGLLPDSGDDPEAVLGAALAALEKIPAAELEEEVYQQIRFILCPSCRLPFRNTVRGYRNPTPKQAGAPRREQPPQLSHSEEDS